MPIESKRELRAIAAAKVVGVLEERWADHLPNGRIPKVMLRALAKTAGFAAMVDTQLIGGALPLPDLDFHPVVERLPNGDLRDLLQEELGDDPQRYVCEDCGEETGRGKGRCDPCEHWRRTGVNPT